MSGVLAWDMQILAQGTQGWESQRNLMQSTAKDFGGASAGSLPPSVQGAASTFLSQWAGYAKESAAIADGFVGALKATSNDYGTADDAADREFSDLDSRLGPSR